MVNVLDGDFDDSEVYFSYFSRQRCDFRYVIVIHQARGPREERA